MSLPPPDPSPVPPPAPVPLSAGPDWQQAVHWMLVGAGLALTVVLVGAALLVALGQRTHIWSRSGPRKALQR